MARAPKWGFDDLTPTSRWVLANGLETALLPPATGLDEVDWRQLRTCSERHGLDGLLIAAVTAEDLPVTKAQRSEAGELEMAMARRRIIYDAAISEPLELLDDAGIELRVVKGASLGMVDYPDLQHRPTSDLDLVVHGSQIRQAVHILVEAGGRWVNPEPALGFLERIAKGATVAMPTGLEVDLHRLLVWGPFGVRLDPNDLWRSKRPATIGGAQRFTLGLEETLVHMCLHLLVLGAVKAREVRDVAQLLTNPDLDEDRAIAVAEKWGVAALVASAVLMAQRELALTAPELPLLAWSTQVATPGRDAFWLRTESPDSPLHGIEQAAVLLEIQDWRKRVLLVRANLMPIAGTDDSPWHRVKTVARRQLERCG